LYGIAGENGAIWFGTISKVSLATAVVRMTTQGAVSNTYALPNHEDTLELAAGPNGSVAFAGAYGDSASVGFVAGGSVTTYPAGAGCGAALIATGSDGNLWTCGDSTAGSNPAHIDRVTPQGVVTTFTVPVPGSGATLYGIAPGPDGALWYVGIVAPSTPIVGRITTAGVVTDYSAAAAAAGAQHPISIVAGPDGAMWFADTILELEANGRAAIGRITTSGVVTEYPLSSPSASPTGITAGYGALWFTDGADNAVGRITTSGAITEYTAGISTGAFPYDITTGPDGAIWFTEWSIGKIGRLSFGTSGSAVRRSPPR
jgi:virginiamycin B lyase